MVLVMVFAVLATRLASTPGTTSATAPASPTPTATATAPMTVPTIYQRAAPSVVLIRAGHDLGTGVIVADDGTILTADHVVAGGSGITGTFPDGTVANASVLSSDKKTDIAELGPVKLPKVVVPATLGGEPDVGASV